MDEIEALYALWDIKQRAQPNQTNPLSHGKPLAQSNNPSKPCKTTTNQPLTCIHTHFTQFHKPCQHIHLVPCTFPNISSFSSSLFPLCFSHFQPTCILYSSSFQPCTFNHSFHPYAVPFTCNSSMHSHAFSAPTHLAFPLPTSSFQPHIHPHAL